MEEHKDEDPSDAISFNLPPAFHSKLPPQVVGEGLETKMAATHSPADSKAAGSSGSPST
jgi:hypothetical protein